ncbi:hypothetical protein C3942_12990 [Solimonas fluminis]|uniref:Uncharacterized protein n=1 Tax=Solimonas fluminis TaxID=2086571 RepID=A0A2S5TFD3_9GAMM|nr:hypothetical protein [Solimonas fluminis]PPE73703.1 hypothetical protein C3942_12990 [Solimonas fluminis]
MRYAKQKLIEMQRWHRFRLAAIAVLSLAAAGFFLYCLYSIADQSLDRLEQTLVPPGNAS